IMITDSSKLDNIRMGTITGARHHRPPADAAAQPPSEAAAKVDNDCRAEVAALRAELAESVAKQRWEMAMLRSSLVDRQLGRATETTIAKEVKSELRCLEVSAKRVAEDAGATTESEAHAAEMIRLQEENEALQHSVAEAESRADAMQTRATDAETKMEKMKLSLTQSDSEVENEKRQVEVLQRKVEVMQAALQRAQTELALQMIRQDHTSHLNQHQKEMAAVEEAHRKELSATVAAKAEVERRFDEYRKEAEVKIRVLTEGKQILDETATKAESDLGFLRVEMQLLQNLVAELKAGKSASSVEPPRPQPSSLSSPPSTPSVGVRPPPVAGPQRQPAPSTLPPISASTSGPQSPISGVFSLRNRQTGRILIQASQNTVVPRPSSTFANTWALWEVVVLKDGLFQFRNVKSGMTLHADSNGSLGAVAGDSTSCSKWRLRWTSDGCFNLRCEPDGGLLGMVGSSGRVHQRAGDSESLWENQWCFQPV
ncbi:hypothetical protein HK101_004350, partial [Irineochytrium annulatum]